MPLVALGAACNLAAILANGGFMPAAPGALAALGKIAPTVYSNSSVVAQPGARAADRHLRAAALAAVRQRLQRRRRAHRRRASLIMIVVAMRRPVAAAAAGRRDRPRRGARPADRRPRRGPACTALAGPARCLRAHRTTDGADRYLRVDGTRTGDVRTVLSRTNVLRSSPSRANPSRGGDAKPGIFRRKTARLPIQGCNVVSSLGVTP